MAEQRAFAIEVRNSFMVEGMITEGEPGYPRGIVVIDRVTAQDGAEITEWFDRDGTGGLEDYYGQLLTTGEAP